MASIPKTILAASFALVVSMLMLFVTLHIFRSMYYFLRFALNGRLVSVSAIRRLCGEQPRVFLLTELWIFRGVVYPPTDGDEGIIDLDALLKHGFLITRIFVSPRFLRSRFPDIAIVQFSVTKF